MFAHARGLYEGCRLCKHYVGKLKCLGSGALMIFDPRCPIPCLKSKLILRKRDNRVCYRAVTALMERFCQNGSMNRPFAHPRAKHRLHGRWGLALPLLCFCATLRLKDRFVYGQQRT